MAGEKKDIGELLSGAGGFTGLGAAFGPVGAGIGAALDVGTLVAKYKSAVEAEAQRQKERNEELGITRTRDIFERDMIRRKEEHNQRLRNAIMQYSRGAA